MSTEHLRKRQLAALDLRASAGGLRSAAQTSHTLMTAGQGSGGTGQPRHCHGHRATWPTPERMCSDAWHDSDDPSGAGLRLYSGR